MFECKVITDSISPRNQRITTLEVTYPRFIHSEIMTHRDRARNAGSSRAIPWPTMMERIHYDPVIPIAWGMEEGGMQIGKELPIELQQYAQELWLRARTQAIISADALYNIGKAYNQTHEPRPEFENIKIHKSLPNRITEPWMWITVVMTATSWRNFFLQRCHPDAEVHFQKIAGMMKDSLKSSVPVETYYHLPYIQEDDRKTTIPPILAALDNDPFEVLLQVSTARCARVSYVQHGEKVKSIDKDLSLFSRLYKGIGDGVPHISPFEHPCVAHVGHSGCYNGWKPYRKFFNNECPVEGYP